MVSTRAAVDQNTIAAEMQREMNRRTSGCEGNLSKIPNKGKNFTVMEKERATQDEMNSGYRPPPTKHARDPEQPDATPSWTGSWR